MRRLLSVLLGLALLVPVSPAPVATAAGLCATRDETNEHIWVEKLDEEFGNPATVDFDAARGDATVANLDPCVGGGSGGGTYILLANLQDDDSSVRLIAQVAYGQECGTCDVRFYYTPNADGVAAVWPGSLTPIKGRRYTGIVSYYRNHLWQEFTKYMVIDKTTGATDTVYRSGWCDCYDRAWWGAEVADTMAELGAIAGSSYPDVNMSYMGYSLVGDGTWIYRSGLTSADVKKSASGIGSNEHGHIGNWVYGGDMLELENH